jgi:hypothetical protein
MPLAITQQVDFTTSGTAGKNVKSYNGKYYMIYAQKDTAGVRQLFLASYNPLIENSWVSTQITNNVAIEVLPGMTREITALTPYEIDISNGIVYGSIAVSYKEICDVGGTLITYYPVVWYTFLTDIGGTNFSKTERYYYYRTAYPQYAIRSATALPTGKVFYIVTKTSARISSSGTYFYPVELFYTTVDVDDSNWAQSSLYTYNLQFSGGVKPTTCIGLLENILYFLIPVSERGVTYWEDQVAVGKCNLDGTGWGYSQLTHPPTSRSVSFATAIGADGIYIAWTFQDNTGGWSLRLGKVDSTLAVWEPVTVKSVPYIYTEYGDHDYEEWYQIDALSITIVNGNVYFLWSSYSYIAEWWYTGADDVYIETYSICPAVYSWDTVSLTEGLAVNNMWFDAVVSQSDDTVISYVFKLSSYPSEVKYLSTASNRPDGRTMATCKCVNSMRVGTLFSTAIV